MGSQMKWLYLLILALIWGSSFILIKRGLVGLTALQLGSLRIIFAALFLLIIGFRSLFTIPRAQWKFIGLTALFGTFIPAYLFSIAEMEIDSSITAILNSLTPLNTLLIAAAFFGTTYRKNQIYGVVVGLLGSLLLVFNGALEHPNQNYAYSLLVFAASICYGINVNLLKRYLSNLSSLSITTGNFVVLLVPALGILCFSDFFKVVHLDKVQYSLVFILILGVIGTGIANIIFFRLIQLSSPVFATSVTYLIPLVACLWGLLDNEVLTIVQFIGALVILAGVFLSAKK